MNGGATNSAQAQNGGARRADSQAFPSLATLKRGRERHDEDAASDQLAEESEKARRLGHQAGYEDGISAARAEAAKLYESARREGRERGVAEGKIEASQAINALRGAHEEVAKIYANLVAELQSFSVEFCLGLVRRLTGAHSLRKAFLIKALNEAMVALKPGGVHAVMLHPSDITLVEGLLNGLNVKEDPLLEPGGFRVEGGPLFVEGSLSAAMAQVEKAMLKKRPSKRATEARGEKA